jgi:hypothetical protein
MNRDDRAYLARFQLRQQLIYPVVLAKVAARQETAMMARTGLGVLLGHVVKRLAIGQKIIALAGKIELFLHPGKAIVGVDVTKNTTQIKPGPGVVPNGGPSFTSPSSSHSDQIVFTGAGCRFMAGHTLLDLLKTGNKKTARHGTLITLPGLRLVADGIDIGLDGLALTEEMAQAEKTGSLLAATTEGHFRTDILR